jgi:hypothetical protein
MIASACPRRPSSPQQLPPDAAIITQLRKPVDRVVSSYEFAIEVAARKIDVDDDDFLTELRNTTFVNTLNVWPWSQLVPWFRRDMQRRVSSDSRTRSPLTCRQKLPGQPPRVHAPCPLTTPRSTLRSPPPAPCRWLR